MVAPAHKSSNSHKKAKSAKKNQFQEVYMVSYDVSALILIIDNMKAFLIHIWPRDNLNRIIIEIIMQILMTKVFQADLF